MEQCVMTVSMVLTVEDPDALQAAADRLEPATLTVYPSQRVQIITEDALKRVSQETGLRVERVTTGFANVPD